MSLSPLCRNLIMASFWQASNSRPTLTYSSTEQTTSPPPPPLSDPPAARRAPTTRREIALNEIIFESCEVTPGRPTKGGLGALGKLQLGNRKFYSRVRLSRERPRKWKKLSSRLRPTSKLGQQNLGAPYQL